MKTPSLKTLLRILGVVVFPFSALFIFIALGASGMQIRDVVAPSLVFGLFLLAVSVYLLFGAPHLVRAIDRRDSR